MKKARRLKICSLLAVSAALACMAGLGARNLSAKAEVNSENAAAFKQGASIRVDGNADGVTGIRFMGYLGATEYAKLIENSAYKEGCEVGVSIIPAKLVQKFENSGAEDFLVWLKDSEKIDPTAVSATFPVEKIVENEGEGNYSLSGVIDVKESNYAYDYQAISYYKENDAVTYLGKSDVRSISYVADAALNDATSKLTDEQKKICADVIVKTTDVRNKGANGALSVSVDSLDDCLQNLQELYFPYVTATDVIYELKNDNGTVALSGGTLSALKQGEETVTVKAYGGLFEYTFNVSVAKDVTFESNAKSVELYTPAILSGKAAEGSEKDLNDLAFALRFGEETKTVESTSITFGVTGDKAVVNSGKVAAEISGAETLNAVYGAYRTEIPVEIYTPVSSAADLDILAMSTYTKTVEEAKEYLSGWYKFTNDIDYSTHTRNFILPIASVTPIYTGNLWGTYTNELFNSGYSNSTSSFYSLGWKDILSLEEATAENGGKYLKNADGTEFRGINPNNLHFTGKINGNGYAIKNAWYMYDNYLGTSYGATLGFVGVNDGIIENLEANVTVPNWFTSYSGGRYCREDWPSYERTNCFAKRYHDAGTILKADGSTMTTNYGEWSDATERGGFVVINALGTVQNVKYNVLYRGRGVGVDVPTSLVCVNSSLIKNCIVAVALGAEYSGAGSLNIPTIARVNVGIGNLELTVDGEQKWLTCSEGQIENVYATYTALNNLGAAISVYDRSKEGNGTTDEKSSVVYKDAAAVKAALTDFDETIWDLGDGSALPTLKKR